MREENNDRNTLSGRMKNYESVSKSQLIPRTPVIIRLDGKSFSKLTSKYCSKPWDMTFATCMWATAQFLCEEIQGCQLAYAQSDEISLLLIDYQTLTTQGWFDYQVQKLCSISSGLASTLFASIFVGQFGNSYNERMFPVFDSRCFNLPKEEVCNYFIWRQGDAVRNSIQSLAQANFSHKELHNVNCDQMQEMLFTQKGINWNDCSIAQKRGVCAVKQEDGEWSIHNEIPTFSKDRNYVDRFVFIDPLTL